jgi:hypothetical protein
MGYAKRRKENKYMLKSMRIKNKRKKERKDSPYQKKRNKA